MIKTLKGLVPWIYWRHIIHNMIRGLVKQYIPQLQRVLLPCWSEMKAQGHFLKGALCIYCKAVPAPVFFYKYPTHIAFWAVSSRTRHFNCYAFKTSSAIVMKAPVTTTTGNSFTSSCVMPGDRKHNKEVVQVVQGRPEHGEAGWNSSFVKYKLSVALCTDPELWSLC